MTVRWSPLENDDRLTVGRPDGAADLARWVAEQPQVLRERLDRHGVLLLRGWDLDADAFERVCQALVPDLGRYNSMAQVVGHRTHVRGIIYNATEIDPKKRVSMHLEMSLNPHKIWPTHLAFCCTTPASKGGGTLFAHNQSISSDMPADIMDFLHAHGLRYRRVLGLPNEVRSPPWRTWLGVETVAEAEAVCKKMGARFAWRDGDAILVMEWTGPIRATHPRTGQTLWVNGLPMFAPGMREQVAKQVGGEHNIPIDITTNDGTPLPDEMIERINRLIDRHTTVMPWEKGDMVLFDNLLMWHGREPFEGERRVYAALLGERGPHDTACDWASKVELDAVHAGP